MSMYYAEHGEFYFPVYNDGRTKQSFKDLTDINKILKKAQKAGTISHLLKYPKAEYGVFEGFDLLDAYTRINKANQIFADLPSEIRREFGGDALAFAKYASDPAHIDRLAQLLPAIARPGSYFPNPVTRVEPSAGVSTPPPADAPAGVPTA